MNLYMCKGQMKSPILAVSVETKLSRIQEILKMALTISFTFGTDYIIMNLKLNVSIMLPAQSCLYS